MVGSSASWMLVRVGFARSWRALLFLALVTSLSLGFVLTAATGARRSATSWPRLLRRAEAPDVFASTSVGDVDTVRADLAARPEVAVAAAFSYMPASPAGLDTGLYAGLGPGFAETVIRPVVLEGRRAEPGRADELMINAPMARLTHLHVGDRTTFTGPFGIDQPARVVAIYVSPLDLGPNGNDPGAIATPAFMARWWPVVTREVPPETRLPQIVARLRPGTDAQAFIRSFGATHPDVGLLGPESLHTDVADGLRAQATAYWVLAGIALLASLALILIVSGRAVRGRAHGAEALAPLGATRVQRAFAFAIPEVFAVAAGVVVAPLLAIVASPLVRTGFARAADPDRGIWVDGRVLALASFGLILLFSLFVLASGWRAARSVRFDRDPIVGGSGSSTALGHPVVLLGLRNALGGPHRSSRRQARAAIAGVLLAWLGVAGVLAWSRNANTLAHSPRRYGWNFDLVVTANVDDQSVLDRAQESLARSDSVSAVARASRFSIPVSGTDIELFALTPEHGSLEFAMLDGRAPEQPDEVALGSATLRRARLHLNDEVSMPSPSGPARMRIVGEALVPPVGNGNWGDVGFLTPAAMKRLGAESLEDELLVRLQPGARPDAFAAPAGTRVGGPTAPPPVAHLDQVGNVDDVLLAFLVLFGITVLAFQLVTTGRRNAKATSVVRGFGMSRRQVLGIYCWQAAALSAIAAVIGIPLGLAAGRVLWRYSTENLGVVDAFGVPLLPLAIVVATTAVVALAAAVAAAVPRLRRPIAIDLHTE